MSAVIKINGVPLPEFRAKLTLGSLGQGMDLFALNSVIETVSKGLSTTYLDLKSESHFKPKLVLGTQRRGMIPYPPADLDVVDIDPSVSPYELAYWSARCLKYLRGTLTYIGGKTMKTENQNTAVLETVSKLCQLGKGGFLTSEGLEKYAELVENSPTKVNFVAMETGKLIV